MALVPASSHPSGNGGTQVVESQAFALTAAQIKTSTLTPVTIIAAQGAGTLVVPTMFVLKYDAGAIPYTASPVELVIGDFNAGTLATPLDQSSDAAMWVFGASAAGAFVGYSEGGDPADYLNKPIRLRASLRGGIVAADVAIPGIDYGVGDTGTVDDGSPNATYIVTAVNASGLVTGYTITSPGDGYNLGAAGAASEWTTTPGGAQPGAGSGLIVSVDSVDASGAAGDGTLSGIVYYIVADLS